MSDQKRPYLYEAMDHEGYTRRGVVVAASEKDAIAKIQGVGLYTTWVREEYVEGQTPERPFWMRFLLGALKLILPKCVSKNLVLHCAYLP